MKFSSKFSLILLILKAIARCPYRIDAFATDRVNNCFAGLASTDSANALRTVRTFQSDSAHRTRRNGSCRQRVLDEILQGDGRSIVVEHIRWKQTRMFPKSGHRRFWRSSKAFPTKKWRVRWAYANVSLTYCTSLTCDIKYIKIKQ